MIQTIDLRGVQPTRAAFARLVPRPAVDVAVAMTVAAELIDDVKEHGAAALAEQAERFDGGAPASVRVPQTEIDAAVANLPADVRAALEEAIERVRRATAAQVPPTIETEIGPGATIVQRWQPVERAGLYVPGGKAVYPSSVVMNAVPAQVAGVASLALASPPQREFGGTVHPTILGAARRER